MALQRQRVLERQQAATGLTNGRVQANEVPPEDTRPSSANSEPRDVISFVSFGAGGTPALEGRSPRFNQEHPWEEAPVFPEPSPRGLAEEAEEAEARRRCRLTHALDERGLASAFDPRPLTSLQQELDISRLHVSELSRFLHDPAPKHAGMIECRILRDRGGINKMFPRYRLESDCGVFLMAAQKQKYNKTSNYTISRSAMDISKTSEHFLGKLRSNFLGLEFVAYGPGLNPRKIDASMAKVHAVQLARQELVAIQYSSSLWGSKPRGPRKMSTVIPRVKPSGDRHVCRTLQPEIEGLLALQKASVAELIDGFQNKPPKWNEQIGAFVLNFNKRVTQASVKNFQLTSAADPDTVYLQFGRVGKEEFNMDFRYPLSPFQAFAICLSSFDYKLCCE